MDTLRDERIVVTGGSRGLGLGLVEAFVARGARVTAVARDPARLASVAQRLGVSAVAADVTDPGVARSILADVRPSVLVLNAGAAPHGAPIHEQTWDAFSAAWNADVKAGFHWIQEAIRLPLADGSRVLVASSGAAVAGSPLSGGYAGAKRMLWLMAQYANGVADEQRLAIRFQALVLRRMIGETGVGDAGAAAYAKKKGTTPEAFLAQFGKPMSARDFGERVAMLLTDARYERSVALGIGAAGVEVLDGAT